MYHYMSRGEVWDNLFLTVTILQCYNSKFLGMKFPAQQSGWDPSFSSFVVPVSENSRLQPQDHFLSKCVPQLSSHRKQTGLHITDSMTSVEIILTSYPSIQLERHRGSASASLSSLIEEKTGSAWKTWKNQKVPDGCGQVWRWLGYEEMMAWGMFTDHRCGWHIETTDPGSRFLPNFNPIPFPDSNRPYLFPQYSLEYQQLPPTCHFIDEFLYIWL